MKYNFHPLLLSGLLLGAALFSSCDPAKKAARTSGQDDGIIEVTFLQMNDVYEISPVGTDNVGGLARVATLRKELLAKNPNTITVLAGDFISPSVIGSLKYEGKRIRGKQMVETLNTLGLDWVVFGNHEFDYDDLADLQARLDESNFIWLGANARLKNPQGPSTAPLSAFYKKRPEGSQACPDHYVVSLRDADGTTLNLGVFGVLLNTGRKPWVEYSDPIQVAKQQYAILQPKTDVVVGLTHLALEDDQKLAAALPNLPLVMGGHEHDNHYEKVGHVAIAKADANAKTVYIHTLRHDKKKHLTTLRSELRRVDNTIADEPSTAAVVAKWDKIMTESLGSLGIDPKAVVTTLREPLDCREVTLRFRQAPAGQMITKAMLFSGNDRLQAALLNSGSVRVDDVLSGTLTELDVVRMLPFGGPVVEAQMRGSLLHRALDVGTTNAGNGGYLQYNGIKPGLNGTWIIAGEPLDDNKTYWIMLPEFLLSGNEQNMAFLKAAPSADGSGTTNADILKINKPDPKNKGDLRNDIRLLLIKSLRGK